MRILSDFCQERAVAANAKAVLSTPISQLMVLVGPHGSKVAERALPAVCAGRRSRRSRRLLECVALALTLFCLGWIAWIITLTVAPTQTANVVMKTSHLEFGEFWRFSDTPGVIVWIGVAALTGAGLVYTFVIGKLLRLMTNTTNSRSSTSVVTRFNVKVDDYTTRLQTMSQLGSEGVGHPWSRRVASRASSVVVSLINRESVERRRMQAVIKITDLLIQCIILVQLLEQGLPVWLLAVFAATVATNAVATAVMFSSSRDNVGHFQIVVDTLSNLMVALVFPVLALTYTLNTFTFNQRLMEINNKSFPPGYFERYAEVVADPVEVENVLGILDSLRIDSVLKVFTRVSTHFGLGRRLSNVLELLESPPSISHRNIYPKRQRALAALAFAIAITEVVYTAGSIHSTNRACQMHPECVQIARRWLVDYKDDDLDRCPCLAIIDRNVAIATYDEWTSPLNRTEKVAQLASAGFLRTLQLVNRGLPFLPEELRRCHNLKHVSLYYTDTLEMPAWFGDFTNLEFLHVQSKVMDKSFQALPDSLFNKLSRLSYIHLAMLAIPRFPSLHGLSGLRSLTVGVLPYVAELPGFSHLHRLERLTFACMLAVQDFPDLTNVRHLKALVAVDRGAFCCNGSLGPDKCNLSHSLCRLHPLWGTPAVTECVSTDRTASPATRRYFDMFNYSACYGGARKPGELKLAPTPQEMAQCNGTMYRECCVAGHDGPAMCFNARWMAVACDPSPFAIQMRRLQIAEAVGKPCDPEIEAWLGCTK